MAEKSREDRIRELKAMRAELMAIKEQMESGDGDDEAASASLASIKNYAEEVDETRQQGETLDDAKREVYSQYESKEQTNNEKQEKTCLWIKEIR